MPIYSTIGYVITYEQVFRIPNQSFEKDKAAEYLLWTIMWLRNVQSSPRHHHALILQKKKIGHLLSTVRSNYSYNFWQIISCIPECRTPLFSIYITSVFIQFLWVMSIYCCWRYLKLWYYCRNLLLEHYNQQYRSIFIFSKKTK